MGLVRELRAEVPEQTPVATIPLFSYFNFNRPKNRIALFKTRDEPP